MYEVYVTCDDCLYIEHLKKKYNESFLCDKDNFVGKLEYSCNISLFIFLDQRHHVLCL